MLKSDMCLYHAHSCNLCGIYGRVLNPFATENFHPLIVILGTNIGRTSLAPSVKVRLLYSGTYKVLATDGRSVQVKGIHYRLQ